MTAKRLHAKVSRIGVCKHGVMRVKNKTVLMVLVLLLSVGLISAVFWKDFFTVPTAPGYRNITDLDTSYNADDDIARALERLQHSQEQAAVIVRQTSGSRQVALTFDGLADQTVMQQVLDLLQQNNSKATFFVDGSGTAETPQTVINIKAAGQKVGNYTLYGLKKMDQLPIAQVVADFCRAQKIITVTTGQGSKLLKCNETNYTGQLLQAAKACGFAAVVKSDAVADVRKLQTQVAADRFVSTLQPGSIIAVKLKQEGDPRATGQRKSDLPPAIDKQPGLKELPQPIVTDNKEIVIGVENLLRALAKARYATVYVESFSPQALVKNVESPSVAAIVSSLIEKIAGLFTCQTAYAADLSEREVKKLIHTTEPALAYTFGGLTNTAAVDDVLTRLRNHGIKATFFVAANEMRRYPQTVRAVITDGHEIGLAIRPKDGATFQEASQAINEARSLLNKQFGVTAMLIKQTGGIVEEATKEAAQALGCILIGQSLNVVQSKHKDYSSASQVMAEVFNKSAISLRRGEILYFRMDFYTNPRLTGDLLELIKAQKVDTVAYETAFDNQAINPHNDSAYTIKPVGELLHNTKYLYQYPVDQQKVPVQLRADRKVIPLGQDNFLAEASKRYIGHPDVTYEDRMAGFSPMEVRRLDTGGRIHTKDNVIFVTFDDWGTDASVSKILYVLRKHGAKATFFVTTRNVLNNTNLLRTIATEGHEIGSHSDLHQAMAVRDSQTGKQVAPVSKEEYVRDFAAAYEKLLAVVGDVTVQGKPALARFFRPATLAVSRQGLEAALETGHEYIINGSLSTYDYKTDDITQLVRRISDGIYTTNGEVNKGAVLIFHMGDSTPHAAVALDILLTANNAKGESDPSKFTVGRLTDYLTAGYSQINRKQSLQLHSHK